MFRLLLTILIVVPAIEIWGLVTVGHIIGGPYTVLLVLLTGVIGAYLAKSQGIKALKRAQQDLHSGRVPGHAILDGLCILVGGIMLLTPGFFTDLIGILFLFPPTRVFIKSWFLYWLQKKITSGNIRFTFFRRF